MDKFNIRLHIARMRIGKMKYRSEESIQNVAQKI